MPLFVHHGVVGLFTDILGAVIGERKCITPAYCFMPDHLHLLISGAQDNSDIYAAVSAYKEGTASWMSKNIPKFRWRKDFSKRVIGENKSLAAEARNLLENPVRMGLVASWKDYPFNGAIGCRLEDVLNG